MEFSWGSTWMRTTPTRPLTGGLFLGAVDMCFSARVSFNSRTQESITLSCTEAEYVASATGFRKTIFLRYFWSFIFPHRDVGYTTVKEDNQGAIHLDKSLRPLRTVSTLMSVITSFRYVLLLGSSRLSTYRRHCSMLILSLSLCTRKSYVFTAGCGELTLISFIDIFWFRIFWRVG